MNKVPQPGWPDVFVKKSPKDNKKSPKNLPYTMFLLDLLYKTVLWCLCKKNYKRMSSAIGY